MGEKVMGFDEENDRIDPEVRKTVAPRVEAYSADEVEDEEQEYALDPSIKPFPQPPPDQTRAVRMVNTGKLDDGVEYWLAWDDESLRALPLDLQQAWAEGPRAWEAALQGTDISYYEPPHDYPVGVRADTTFRAAEHSYMKAHLSAEDYAWYLAGERVGTMRDEAQAVWKKGPSAWAAFLAPPRPKPAA